MSGHLFDDDRLEIPITQPEYMTWDIEKLRKEYRKLSLQYSGLKLREATVLAAQDEVDELARLFNKFLDRERNYE